ncbi:undecaprenyl-phosphate glucose phosphotransferase [Gorillibacterium timonense]|uniref:undecaprenyl-phosphate glucose phosphotransferase n=1 Tax=Gorillibacterium timonense TaxID=1689269 RepID=UPI00071D1F68|nr:undecaprenyl-phosphate glucose phosphotransferase [Gorillibacterium timonense]
MIRRNQSLMSQLYALCDFLVIQMFFFAAWWMKFVSPWAEGHGHLPLSRYYQWVIIYSGIVIMLGFFLHFYTPKRKKTFAYETWKIVQIHAVAFLVLLSFLFLAKEVDISREFLAIFITLNIFGTCLYRLWVKHFLRRMRRNGFNKQFVLILGAGSLGRRFYKNLQQQPELGFEVVGFLDDFVTEHEAPYADYKSILGKTTELEAMLERYPIDEVVIALPLNAYAKYGTLINVCEKAGVRTMIIPDFFNYLPARPSFDNFAGIPLINVRDIPLDNLNNRILKRVFDLLFSVVAILITSPVMLAIAIGIKLTSSGPVIFKQERVGFNRRTFPMYKFRSMRVSEQKTADQQWTVENDPRRTGFGSFLRRTSLDELPQFFNVLFGHMSVVGPRPERPHFVEQFKEEVPKYMVKHHVRPGMTGWAQSNGLRGDTSIPDRISYDIYYLENWSFLFDLRIIVQTLWKGLVNKNAY